MESHVRQRSQNLQPRRIGQSALVGGTAGFVATVPMTVAMMILHRLLPRRERFAWPPQIVTRQADKKTSPLGRLEPDTPLWLTLAAHFGFGTMAGALYGLVASMLPRRPLLSGSLYGLVVWMSSYLGWLPITGLYHPPDKEPPRRHALMIAAHLVWGPVLGLLVHRMENGDGKDEV